MIKRSLFCTLIILLVTVSLPLLGQNVTQVKLKTIVIDPGHGGRDPGSVSKDNRLYEKNVVLPIALELGKTIKENYPDIKVIYTRTTDKFIPLYERSAIANRNNADLFISIHINSTKSTSAKGVETHIMGMDHSKSNLEVCLKENNVITLEEDYSSKYEGYDPKNPESFIIFSLLQNSHVEQSLLLASMVQDNLKNGPFTTDRGIKQAPILVLWKCTMPAILVELGFISNSAEAKSLATKNTQKRLATSLFKAFQEYKKKYEKVVVLPEKAPVQKTDNESVKSNNESLIYRIQIMASSKKLSSGAPEFKGLKCESVKSGNLYKYTTGRFATREKAKEELEKVKKLFPQAFIVAIE